MFAATIFSTTMLFLMLLLSANCFSSGQNYNFRNNFDVRAFMAALKGVTGSIPSRNDGFIRMKKQRVARANPEGMRSYTLFFF